MAFLVSSAILVFASSGRASTSEQSTAICFADLHPEFFRMERSGTKTRLASSVRGRARTEVLLSPSEAKSLEAAISTLEKNGQENSRCAWTVSLEFYEQSHLRRALKRCLERKEYSDLRGRLYESIAAGAASP